MTDINIIYYLLTSICVAEFAMQMQLSSLAYKVKLLLGLLPSDKLDILCKKDFWMELIGWWIIPTYFMRAWRYITELVNCPYCSGFWLAFATNYFYLKTDIVTAIVLAPLALVFVAGLNKLHS